MSFVVNHFEMFFSLLQQESFNGQSNNFSGGGYSYGQGNGVGHIAPATDPPLDPESHGFSNWTFLPCEAPQAW